MTVRQAGYVDGPQVSLRGARRGLVAIAPIAVVVVPFGMSFGVAATNNGIPAWVAMVMSASVMAGGAQFAAIDLWHTSAPLIPLTMTVLAINSRHFLFGASLGQWLDRFPVGPRLIGVGFISDPSWALTDNAVRDGENDLGFLLGCGGGLWISWVSGTGIGLIIGDVLGDRFVDYGLDTLLVTYFAALLVPLWGSRSSLIPWIAAAIISIWGRDMLPEGWNVLAAAAVCGALGAMQPLGTHRDQPSR